MRYLRSMDATATDLSRQKGCRLRPGDAGRHRTMARQAKSDPQCVGCHPPPGRARAEGEGEMNKPSTRPAAPATTQAHCNTCGGTRKHDVLFSKRKHWDDSVDGGRHSISGTDT